MAEVLAQKLLQANRIKSRRMEIIREIKPNMHNRDEYLEDIIENNYGGMIVFDLSEKFGYESTDYIMVCKYLEKLLKKYRNQCLFIFVYNMEKPGFAYYLLPELKKYILPVTIKEGKGDRKAAIEYMEALIRKSEYSNYTGQAKEFFASYPENEFSQTDVLMAHEKFEAWCLNKNVLQAYDYDISEDFMLDRDENEESAYGKLQKMVGLNKVKEQIDSIIAADIVEKERKKR